MFSEDRLATSARGGACGTRHRGVYPYPRPLPVHPRVDPGNPDRGALAYEEGAPPRAHRRGARGALRRRTRIGTRPSSRITSEKPRRFSARTSSSSTPSPLASQRLPRMRTSRRSAHFERGLAAKGDADDGRRDRSALLRPRSSPDRRVRARTSWSQQSTSLRRAFDYYAQVGDVSRASRGSLPDSPFVRTGVHGLPRVDRARLTLVAADSHEAGLLLAQHGWFSGIVEADYSEAQRRFSVRCRLHKDRTTQPSSAGRSPMPPSRTCGISVRTGLTREGAAGDPARPPAPATSRPRSTLADPSSWALMSSGELKQIRAPPRGGAALAEWLRERWSLCLEQASTTRGCPSTRVIGAPAAR